jgi:phosphoglycolate phosphatase-like HAD superfamily hydrolase
VRFWGHQNQKFKNVEFLLEKYALSSEKCLYFGDAESDYRAAVACNVNFIGIVSGTDAPLLQVAPEVKWARNFIDLIV